MEPLNKKPVGKPVRSMDGLLGSPMPIRRPLEKPARKPPKRRSPKQQRLILYAQLAGIVVVGLGLGILFPYMPLGQVAILIYGVIALWRRIPSDATLKAALISLAVTTVLGVVKAPPLLSENFAVYTFLLLVIGLVTAGFELRRQTKQRKEDAHK